jgi:hypothetical protein
MLNARRETLAPKHQPQPHRRISTQVNPLVKSAPMDFELRAFFRIASRGLMEAAVGGSVTTMRYVISTPLS